MIFLHDPMKITHERSYSDSLTINFPDIGSRRYEDSKWRLYLFSSLVIVDSTTGSSIFKNCSNSRSIFCVMVTQNSVEELTMQKQDIGVGWAALKTVCQRKVPLMVFRWSNMHFSKYSPPSIKSISTIPTVDLHRAVSASFKCLIYGYTLLMVKIFNMITQSGWKNYTCFNMDRKWFITRQQLKWTGADVFFNVSYRCRTDSLICRQTIVMNKFIAYQSRLRAAGKKSTLQQLVSIIISVARFDLSKPYLIWV